MKMEIMIEEDPTSTMDPSLPQFQPKGSEIHSITYSRRERYIPPIPRKPPTSKTSAPAEATTVVLPPPKVTTVNNFPPSQPVTPMDVDTNIGNNNGNDTRDNDGDDVAISGVGYEEGNGNDTCDEDADYMEGTNDW